ncbi:hypothetical protein PQR25_00045 [Paraburkholderia nemoris]|uniref:hypothetical protein n=1 Tax=Paraburkholderia nemoris TaxID=2793076 RepID=UPI0038B814E9
MKFKTPLLKLLITCGCATVPMLVNAQSIPPSCQRYVTAMKVCGRDLLRYEELMQPDQVPQLRSQIDDGVNSMNSMFRQAVREHGVDQAGKFCTSQALSSQIVPKLTNLMTALSIGDAASEACQDAYGKAVVPALAQ